MADPQPQWGTLLGLGGRAGRKRREGGEWRCCLADFLPCRADADVSCQLPWFSGASSLLSRLVENSPHTKGCARGAERSQVGVLASLEVDLPVFRCPILWDWPNGHLCSLPTPPFCVNCPRQVTKLFLEPEQGCTLPSLRGSRFWLEILLRLQFLAV